MVVDGAERIAAGVDVSLVRGLDVVVLDGSLSVVGRWSRVAPDDLGDLVAEVSAAVVAIDSPPGPAHAATSRAGERALLRMGIHCYCTPSDPDAFTRPFYRWMAEGHRAFASVAAVGYALYRGGATVRGHALEVFPHATAMLLGADRTRPKREHRRAVLEARGFDTSALRTLDQIDAALAALTGLLALAGRATALGDPAEGVLVVPQCADGGTRTLTPFGTGT